MVQSKRSAPSRSLSALALLVLAMAVVRPNECSAGDAFLRGGLILSPGGIDSAARWRLAFGSDYPVNFDETLFAGFEGQLSAYRQDVVGVDRTATFFPANAFVNVKYKSGGLGVRPYGGGGIGLVGSFLLLSGGNDWSRDLGFHVLGGVELGRLGLELQLQRAFASGADTTFTAYAGFVW